MEKFSLILHKIGMLLNGASVYLNFYQLLISFFIDFISIYKVFDLKNYTMLYSISDKNVQEIKIR